MAWKDLDLILQFVPFFNPESSADDLANFASIPTGLASQVSREKITDYVSFVKEYAAQALGQINQL